MSKKDKLAALRAARAAGTSRHVNLSDEGSDNEDDLFEVVSEDEFRERKRQEFLQDDFVEDDNGEGYVDDGTDDFGIDGKHSYYHTEEEIREKRKKLDKKEQLAKKRQKTAAANAAANADIGAFFTKSASSSLMSSKKKASADVDFSDLLQELPSSNKKKSLLTPKSTSNTLNIFNSNQKKTPSFQIIGSTKFGATPGSTGSAYFTAPTSRKTNNIFLNKSSSIKNDNKKTDFDDDDDGFETAADTSFDFMGSSPTKGKAQAKFDTKNLFEDGLVISETTPTATAADKGIVNTVKENSNGNYMDSEHEDEDEEDVIIVKRQRVALNSVKRDINLSSTSKRLDSHIKQQQQQQQQDDDDDEADGSMIKSSPTKSSISSPSSKNVDLSQIVDSDGKFRIFWLDYAELDNNLLIYGKTKSQDGSFVSTMVQITNFQRQLHILPRPFRLVDGEVTEDKCTTNDVHEEIIPLLMDKFGLDTIRTKPTTKKYCFELPNIPKEAEYLTVLLPFNPPKSAKVTLPADLEGETFSHIFGANSSLFETFVLDRNIMGPCWLEISNGDFTAVANSSHCKLEVLVNNPKFVIPIEHSTKNFKTIPPPLTCCSISTTIVLNQKENKQEIVAVTLATYMNLPQDAPIPEDLKPTELITLVRSIGSTIPQGLNVLAEKSKLNLRQFGNEKMLLSCLAGLIKQLDPDVFIGHKLESVSLDILLHRMHDFKIPSFSTLGRRVRRSWPDKFGKGSNAYNSSFLLRDIFSGRLLCDISNELGQSLTPKCQSWELAEMYDVVCKKKFHPLEINLNNPVNSENPQTFFMILKENCQTALITAEISFRIQILSLSKQLTNLAGNGWCHTLSGTRAGRNEFILLHEFNKNGYILPDKETRATRLQHQQYLQTLQSSNNGAAAQDDDDDIIDSNTNTTNTTGGKGKSKFQGGLVFEPERGLHKNYILVMDFNSLYPSIIQEFNICFTSVDRNPLDQDILPEVPSSSVQQGVLPRLLSNLVNRRREVKKLLKDPTSTSIERAQYDIKQQALKLTANSMYGCLGYVNSRFYAKPLAMLVTNKGREILMDTRQLAESLGLKVVYGDTDSVMIDTGCMNFKDAIKIGEDFKVQVNERYRLLEIDIDNVFKKLLLHAKKKYAALNVSFDFKTGTESTLLEVKGLDMKRREYCPLSKEVSTYVLEQIMSEKEPEESLKDIYEYLEDITKQIQEDKIRHDKFKINTKLSKDPTAYPGGKSMPAVQVAFRLREQGKVIKAGSVITYVVCAGPDDQSVSERSRAITEVIGKNSELKPDPNFYLEKQLFAPVERLLEKIEDIDLVRLAEALGIKNYRLKVTNGSSSSSSTMDSLQPLESTISDAERFKNTRPLRLHCTCGVDFSYGGVVASHDYIVGHSGVKCLKCSQTFSTISITSQLENRIRSYISLYYQGFVSCDDRTCGMVTKHISVYGRRCLAAGCKGIMSYQYSDKELYNQLLYFEHLFDSERNISGKLKPLYEEDDKTQPKKLDPSTVKAITNENTILLNQCRSIVGKYLNNNGRKYVDMRSIFGFMES